jgi:copper(I)-binding protein
MRYCFLLSAVLGLANAASQGCDLKIENAWIREAPSVATTLAGYAQLINTGKQKLSLASVQSAAFADIQMHESIIENGVAKMPEIPVIELAPGEKVSFAPGGKHFMLINPKPGLRAGENVQIKITDSQKCVTTAAFKISKDAVGATDKMDHSQMDHSQMDHENMHHDQAL